MEKGWEQRVAWGCEMGIGKWKRKQKTKQSIEGGGESGCELGIGKWKREATENQTEHELDVVANWEMEKGWVGKRKLEKRTQHESSVGLGCEMGMWKRETEKGTEH